MFSIDVLAALALLAIFFWVLAGFVGYWKRANSANVPRPVPASMSEYLEQGNFFYHRLDWPVRAVISIASTAPKQRYENNRATITLCFITAFVHSIKMISPGVMGNTSEGWAQWTEEGLRFAYGANSLQKPLSKALVAAASRTDRMFLVDVLKDAIHKKVTTQESDSPRND